MGMKLSDIIQMQPGWDFRFRNNVAVVKWTEFDREEVARDDKGEPVFKNNFNMCFWYRDRSDGEEKYATLHSSHPRPDRLELSEFIA